MARRLSAAIALIAVAIGGVVLALALMEGAASLAITAGLLLSSRGRLAQERYATYDPDLGWVSLPNLDVPDMYGPGVGLHTDGLGFRGRRTPSATPPVGKVRVVCSGDSFTFGYGVADDEAWCARLAGLDARIEPVNMGQGGYGVDQAFLWYRRAGAPLRPAIHLFAFIDGDFARMQSDRFLDYGKPTLALADGALRVEHVPAWRRPFWMPSVRVRDIVKRSRSYELYDRLVQRRRRPPAAPALDPAARGATEDVALAVFAELATIAQRNGGSVVLVYLPITVDCAMPPGTAAGLDWWRTIGPRARAAGFSIIDLSEDCRRMRAAELARLFFPPGAIQYYGAGGHYTAAGHEFFARAMYAQLRARVDAAASR